MRILAIDFGGTRTRAALFDETMTIIERAEVPTKAHEPQQAVIDRIVDVGRQVTRRDQTTLAVGVAAPGPLDAERGVILQAETLPGWRDVPLAKILSDALGTPTYIQNDANLAALAEASQGAGRNKNPVVYLTLSTGIGGGAVIDGQLFTGWRSLAIEPGHQVFRLPDGRVKKLEELASGTAIGALAAERAKHTPSILRGYPAIDGKAVGEAAVAGDELARVVVREAAEWLGLGIVNLLHLFNPQVIVLGASVTNLGELLLRPMRDTVAKHVLSEKFMADDLIQLAGLGEDVCLIGAAHLAASKASL